MPFNDPNLPLLVRLQRAPLRLMSWLTTAGGKIIAPIDQAALFVVRKAVSAFERIERLEVVLLWVARPFFAMAR